MVYRITEQEYMYALEVLPPIMLGNGLFQVSEPYDHNKDGQPTYATYKQIDDKFYEVGIMDTNKAIREWLGVTEIISDVEYSEDFQAEEEFEALDYIDQVKVSYMKYEYNYSLKEALEEDWEDIDVIEANNLKELGVEIVEQGYFGHIIPKELEYYTDYEAIGHDWSINGFREFEYDDKIFYCQMN